MLNYQIVIENLSLSLSLFFMKKNTLLELNWKPDLQQIFVAELEYL